ncbi:MAG TPA: hypothetical protein DCZ91_16050 [Lachnospiraceae bacterium]|nr:hypothetical protein [Lachnospiraceae bacterium]
MNYTGERFLPDECQGEISIEHYQRYQFASRLSRGKAILDAACGEGYGSSLLAREASAVVGLDIDPAVIENARQKYTQPGLSFVTGSIASLPFEDHSFDMAVSFETIEHVDIPTQEAFLTEIKRVLKPEGILVMSTPNRAVYTDLVSGTNHFHIREFYVREYEDFLGKLFRNVCLFGQFPDLGYFIMQPGTGETIRHESKPPEQCRYLIALCSEADPDTGFDTSGLARFDDSMYYSLNTAVHNLESTVLKTKAEAENFQARQEQSIAELKNLAASLEQDISNQKKYVEHLERDLAGQKEYIPHLEKDIQTQKEYICRLEKDMKTQKEYICHLEKDIQTQKEYICRLEDGRDEQAGHIVRLEQDGTEYRSYIAHLENDISEQKQYIAHLEQDIKIQAEYIQKLGNRST